MMPIASTALTPELEALLATRREGHGMPRPFYHTDALYEAEMRKIWYGGWLFAGFAFEIPNPGDYLTFEVDTSSVIVMRDDDGEIGAFHNVCRHRGTQLCRNESGHLASIVCPYHSWTYSRHGELIACHGMQEDIDKSKHWPEARARRGGRGPHLHFARRDAAVVRGAARRVRARGASRRDSIARASPR